MPVHVGMIIQRGAWGAKTRAFHAGGRAIDAENAPILMWEVALEAARQAARPLAPSRLDCVFTFEKKLDAVWFRDTSRSGYAVVGCVPNEPWVSHRGDFGLLVGSQMAYVDHMAAVANRYWICEPTIRAEVLVARSIRVTEIVG